MKEIFIETTFWIGASIVVVGLLILLLWLIEKAFDLTAKLWDVLWNVYEYVYYRKDFDNWIVLHGKERHWRVQKRIDKENEKRGF